MASRSQPIHAPTNNQRYADNFVVARHNEVEVYIDLILVENAFYVANLTPGKEISISLTSLIPDEPQNLKSCRVENQCVSFVEKMMGREFGADAKYIPVNEDQPCEGCGVVFWGGEYGHIAYILEVESPSMLLVEQNRIGCGIISTRSIQFEELNNLKGFVK